MWNDTIIIKEAKEEDAEGIIKCMQSVMDEKIYLLAEKNPYTIDTEKFRIKNNKEDLILVAQIGGTIIGTLNLNKGRYKKTRHVGFLSIVVTKRYRNTGIGKSLLNYALRWCEINEIKKICLEVFSTNIQAIKLYEDFGFKEESRRTKQYKIKDNYMDGVFMAKWL